MLGEGGGKAEAGRLTPSARRSPSPPRAPQPRQSRLRALPWPGPARPGTSFLHRTHLTRHGCSRRGRGRPGRRVPEGRPGWEPGAGCGGSPGRGWVPQRRFQLFRCLKLAPAERCGHVTERRQSAPACLRVPAPNARRPEERRPRPGGRVRRSPGLEGRREGRAGGGQRAAPPRLSRESPWSTSFRGSARHSAGGRPARPALVSGPALGAARPRLRDRALRVLRPVQPRGRQEFIYFPDRLYGAGDTVADRGVPSRGPPSGGEGARKEINRPVEF